VLTRPKFDRYFVDKVFTRFDFLASFEQVSEIAEVTQTCTDCVDPKDNMFLSLAVSVGADCIVFGDKAHLISMHSYREIHILSVGDFLLKGQRPQPRQLETTQRGTLDVTPRLSGFLACLLRAVQGADGLLAGVLGKLGDGGRSTGYVLNK